MRRQHEAGDAEAALGCVVVEERGLDRRELAVRAEALDRGDGRPVDRAERDETGAPRLAVHENGARAAAALEAARLGARDRKLLAQGGEERLERRSLEVAFGAA